MLHEFSRMEWRLEGELSFECVFIKEYVIALFGYVCPHFVRARHHYPDLHRELTRNEKLFCMSWSDYAIL